MKKKAKAYDIRFFVPAKGKEKGRAAHKIVDAFSIAEAKRMAEAIAKQTKTEVISVVLAFTY